VKSRKLLIIILVIALLAVYYLLGTGYLKQKQEHEALASQIAGATQALAQIPPPPADLEQQLAAAKADLDEVKNNLPDSLNCTMIINTILRLAEEVGVKAIPLATQAQTTESFNEVDYSVFRLNVVLEGTFARISEFLNRLEKGEPETLVIEYMNINSPTDPFGGEGVSGSTPEVSATINISVYYQPPVTDTEEEGD